MSGSVIITYVELFDLVGNQGRHEQAQVFSGQIDTTFVRSWEGGEAACAEETRNILHNGLSITPAKQGRGVWNTYNKMGLAEASTQAATNAHEFLQALQMCDCGG